MTEGPPVAAGRVTRAGVATHVGQRRHNEDVAVALDGVYLVADGMGGHAAGEVAASIAARSLAELAGRPRNTPGDVLDRLTAANHQIARAARNNPAQRGMRTTLAGVIAVHAGGSQHWMVLNVGDSRVYRYLRGSLAQVTVDHTEIRELLDAGVIDEAEAALHPARNVVTRSLGETQMGAPDVWVFPPEDGEVFLVCSDGLSGVVPPEEIEECLRTCTDVQVAADALVRRAVDGGGRDNVTAIVLRQELRDETAASHERDDRSDGRADSSDEDTAPRLGGRGR